VIGGMRKHSWLYYIGCVAVPHIMLCVGLVLLSGKDVEGKALGKKICVVSASILTIGSLLYYVFFTPMFGLD